MASTWTETQSDAIRSLGKNLLVSAAAGSGKTSVLTQRCVYLVCDAPEPCDVGDLLVVTYTEAAAAEMKSRFAKALAERYAEQPDPRIGKQLAMIDRAYIGTLHGFCARILRRHFNQIGLDPGFAILDPDEGFLLRRETADQLFIDRYGDESDDFRNFVDAYAGGNDERLISTFLAAHDLLGSIIHPGWWLEESAGRIAEAIDLPINQSVLGRAMLADVDAGLTGILRQCDAALEVIAPHGPLAKYHAYLADFRRSMDHVYEVFGSFGIDGAADVLSTIELPKLPSIGAGVTGRDRAKQLIDDIRGGFKDDSWRKALVFTGQQWVDGLKQIQPHLNVLLSLLGEFAERFSAAKLEEGVVDFADLERLTLRCLTEPADDGKLVPNNIARQYQSTIKHVLVDEYQDINEVQEEILSLLSHEKSSAEKMVPNLFCVGDVKQSVYRFRLADPTRFLRRRKNYLAGTGFGRVIDLQQNFRSRAPLLDVINTVFAAVMSEAETELDYDETQQLKPAAEFPPGGSFAGAPVELYLLETGTGTAAAASAETESESDEDLGGIELEAVLIGRRILDLVGKSGSPGKRVYDHGKYRPARFGDVVVLLRALSDKADPLAAVLRRMGIPVFSESRSGYFTATEVNDVLAVLHLLDNVRQDVPLAAFLRGPVARLEEPESAMALVRVAYPDAPFHDAVWTYAAEQKTPLAGVLRQLQTQLAAWRQLAREQPVVELVRVLYEQTGLLTYAAGLPGGQQRAANLVELRERAGQFGTFRRQGLGRFLRFLEKLKDQSDLGQAAVSSEAEDVVRIVSIHRSKGLEFPIVILPDLGKGINFRSEIGGVIVDRGFGFGLAVVDEQREVQYPSLATAVVKRRLHRQTVAEEVRVLYVAMTRAKEHLILIGSAKAKQLLRWKSAEGDAAGPLPPDVVAGAKRPLDWIAPVAYRAGAGLFEIRVITAAELGSIPEPETKLTGVQQSRAELMPLEVSAATSVEAAGMIRRVTAEYAFAGATGMAAAVSVTSLVKNVPVGVVLSAGATAGSVGGTPVLRSPPLEEFDVGEVSDGGESDSGLAIKSLDLPAFFRPVALSAADRGTATHAVLEHLKFADADSVEAITRQMDDLVKTHRLTEAERAEVNVGSILWMMQQPVGELLRSRADLVKREVPIYFDTGGGDPSDRQMVRGRIDLMVDDGNGWAIVDYKTDRVEGEQLLERAGSYAGQLQLYAEAIERVTSRPVTSATLVFLTPRVVHDVRLGRH